MKKWIWAVLIFLVAGIVGGYSVAHYRENQLQYSQNVVSGQTAIEQGNYAAAENYFLRALTKKKEDQTATNLLNQTKKFVRAESEFKSHEFTSARIDYGQVNKYKKASNTLKKRSDKRIKLIDKIKKNVKKFNQQLKDAKAMNAQWNFYGSNATLDILLSNPEFKKNYYAVLYDQVVVLQRFNNAGIVADQGAFTSDRTPDDNKKSSSRVEKEHPEYRGPDDSEALDNSKQDEQDESDSSSKVGDNDKSSSVSKSSAE